MATPEGSVPGTILFVIHLVLSTIMHLKPHVMKGELFLDAKSFCLMIAHQAKQLFEIDMCRATSPMWARTTSSSCEQILVWWKSQNGHLPLRLDFYQLMYVLWIPVTHDWLCFAVWRHKNDAWEVYIAIDCLSICRHVFRSIVLDQWQPTTTLWRKRCGTAFRTFAKWCPFSQ